MDGHLEKYLAAELKAGSKSGFDAIYHLYVNKLYSFVYSYTRSRTSTEEIVQDVFVRLWNARASIKNGDSLGAFIFTIAKNLTINSFRATVNSPVFEEYLGLREKLSDNRNADAILEYDDLVETVRKIAGKMPPTRRKIVLMSKIGQMKNKEIAEALALSEQTVKNQLTAGMKTLREELMKIFGPLSLIILIGRYFF
ncbi:MAG: RNA polymerase sigma-70 factor [Candidatus Cryptobacteroides sp.]